MRERALAGDLTERFSRLTWLTLSGYALVVLVAFAGLGEVSLSRSMGQTATVIESLLGLYADPGGERSTVPSDSLAAQLVGMGARFIITRTAPAADGGSSVYFLSPSMPAKRIESLGSGASPEAIRSEILSAVAARGRWRYRVQHRQAGEFDIFVAGSREPQLIAFAAMAGLALLLLPAAAIAARRATRRAVARALAPVHRVRTETLTIGPSELNRRVTSPTGVTEVTQIAESINRLIERVEASHRALEAFTADASHELRTPLTFLRAQAQWALDTRRTADEMRDALGAIGDEVERTSKLVEDLLLLARSDNHALELVRHPFDLAPIAAEAREIGEAMAHGRNVQIVNGVAGSTLANGDAHYTRHVILNIVTNAVRHTTAGTVTLDVRHEPSRVALTVRDTGEGIAAENLEHIFDRFYRVEKSRSRDHGGVGLGLAIARMLTELQGGTVSVESTIGVGSVFSVWLPAADPEAV